MVAQGEARRTASAPCAPLFMGEWGVPREGCHKPPCSSQHNARCGQRLEAAYRHLRCAGIASFGTAYSGISACQKRLEGCGDLRKKALAERSQHFRIRIEVE